MLKFLTSDTLLLILLDNFIWENTDYFYFGESDCISVFLMLTDGFLKFLKTLPFFFVLLSSS